MLHNQIDGLFSAIAQRPENSTGTGAHSEPSLNTWKEGEREFKIAIVGDSTMRVKLGWYSCFDTCDGIIEMQRGFCQVPNLLIEGRSIAHHN